MRSGLGLILLGSLVAAIPAPQAIDLDGIIANGPPPPISYATKATVIKLNPTSLANAAAAAVSTGAIVAPTDAPDYDTDYNADYSKKKRDVTSASSACKTAQPQPTGAGAKVSPDNASAFLAYAPFASTASAAPTPSGYINTFTNLQGESQAYGYLGYSLLSSYDTVGCANQCNDIFGCMAVNVAFERAPSVNPQTGCDDPPSTTLIKCVFWGAPLSATTATNTGQYRDNFQVVITGSNGYVKTVVGIAATDFEGPSQMDDAAINALYDCNNAYTYMGYMEFSDGVAYDPTRCTAACSAQSEYNLANGINQTCQFVNAYLLLKNGQVQGQICSFYNETWNETYATNTGYFYESDVYTIAASVTYSNQTNPGVCVPSPSPSVLTSSSIPSTSTVLTSSTIPSTTPTAASSPTPTAISSNLIPNGDFSEGYNVDWATTSGTTGTYSVQPSRTDSGPDGNGALLLSCGSSSTGSAGSIYYSSATFDVTPGTNYTVSFAYYYIPGQNGVASGSPVLLTLEDVSSGYSVSTGASTAIAGSNTYSMVTGDFVAGSAGETELVFGLVCAKGDQAVVEVDEVVLVPASGF